MKTVLSPEVASAESLVAEATNDFMDRLARGEQPDVEEWAQRFPQIAAVLRQVLPALQAVQSGADLLAEDNRAAETCISGYLGDYRILREIGRGGMGIVYEAEQISLARQVALKVLPFAAAMDPRQLQRFKNEAQAAAHLHHTNIVPVHAVGCERGVHYYVMQFIEGQTLAAMNGELRKKDVSRRGAEDAEKSAGQKSSSASSAPLREINSETPPVAAISTVQSTKHADFFRTVAQLGIQAAEALEYAHSMGIVHRDIKPGNLLLDMRDNLWITDFGLAQFQKDGGLTMTGDLLGTLRYMSPEQALAKRVVVDHRTDIYSLGVTVYELLTLEPAIRGQDRQELLRRIAFEEPDLPRRINKSIPAELETIVLKAIEKNPEERYGTAQEVAEDLRRWLEHKPIKAKRPTPVQRVRKFVRRHENAVTATTLATLAGLIVIIGVLWNRYLEIQDREKRIQEAHRQEIEAKQELEIEAASARRQMEEMRLRNLTLDGLLESATTYLRNGAWLREPRELLSFDDVAQGLAYSPDGRYLVSAGWIFSRIPTLTLYDVAAGKRIETLEFRAPIWSFARIAFSPDGRQLAIASQNAVQTMDVNTRQLVGAFPIEDVALSTEWSPQVMTVAYSSDGRQRRSQMSPEPGSQAVAGMRLASASRPPATTCCFAPTSSRHHCADQWSQFGVRRFLS